MSTKPISNEFEAIALEALQNVAGGAARSKSGDSEITAMLSSITSSIKDLSSSKNNQSMDPMMMIVMMMMMGGGGGGGGVLAAPAVGAPPVINVDTGVSGGGGCFPCRPRGKGKKGW